MAQRRRRPPLDHPEARRPHGRRRHRQQRRRRRRASLRQDPRRRLGHPARPSAGGHRGLRLHLHEQHRPRVRPRLSRHRRRDSHHLAQRPHPNPDRRPRQPADHHNRARRVSRSAILHAYRRSARSRAFRTDTATSVAPLRIALSDVARATPSSRAKATNSAS